MIDVSEMTQLMILPTFEELRKETSKIPLFSIPDPDTEERIGDLSARYMAFLQPEAGDSVITTSGRIFFVDFVPEADPRGLHALTLRRIRLTSPLPLEEQGIHTLSGKIWIPAEEIREIIRPGPIPTDSD